MLKNAVGVFATAAEKQTAGPDLRNLHAKIGLQTLAIVFLLPLIKSKEVSKIPDFFSFFAPYFIFLFLEIVMAMKILKRFDYKFTTVQEDEKNKSV